MMKLEGLAAFTAVADAGSISEAARRLGVPKSVVGERLALIARGDKSGPKQGEAEDSPPDGTPSAERQLMER